MLHYITLHFTLFFLLRSIMLFYRILQQILYFIDSW